MSENGNPIRASRRQSSYLWKHLISASQRGRKEISKKQQQRRTLIVGTDEIEKTTNELSASSSMQNKDPKMSQKQICIDLHSYGRDCKVSTAHDVHSIFSKYSLTLVQFIQFDLRRVQAKEVKCYTAAAAAAWQWHLHWSSVFQYVGTCMTPGRGMIPSAQTASYLLLLRT